MEFNELASLWLDIKKYNIKDITDAKNRSYFHNHIFPFFFGEELSGISEREILDWVEWQREKGNAHTGGAMNQNSIIRGLNYISNIFGLAQRKDIITYNPVSEIKLSKIPAKKYEIYARKEVDRIIKSARPKWLGDMTLLAYHTGMRRGEIYGLQWSDINFAERILYVQRSVGAYYPGPVVVGDVKTKSSRRYIMFDDQILRMFYRRIRQEPKSEWVFTNKNGDVCSPCYHAKYFRLACVNAGIQPRRFHDLRHTHITELVNAGIPLPVIQQRAGHSNINTTMSYTHISVDAQEIVVKYYEG